LDVYEPDGVDLSLIRWTLSMTPAQRLQVLQSAADSLARMRNAGLDAPPRSDFSYEGSLNLQDVGVLAANLGHGCP
jgi:hypothetical protein